MADEKPSSISSARPVSPISHPSELLTTNRKALTINLDPSKYGTFAEIGAGQEVARNFFRAGGASGTVAKTMSAYDMKFSDAIYGKSPRYVSRERLITMLDHEYELLEERLAESRGEETCFFVFADTVATSNFKHTNDPHGWMGIRFQTAPGEPPNDVILHVRMLDRDGNTQQQALGTVGVNLIYGAQYYYREPRTFIQSLNDNLLQARIEIDMIKFSGPVFESIDNRLMSLLLIEHGFTNAVLFGPSGEVFQPSEILHKKAILVERGSFHPVTKVNIDMLECARKQFEREKLVQGHEVLVLMEITMSKLKSGDSIDYLDFLDRVDTLAAIGQPVLVSNYFEYFRLTSYFRRYTQEMIGVPMGIKNLIDILNERYYEHLEGGILEAFGRLFRNAVKLYIYPRLGGTDREFLEEVEQGPGKGQLPASPPVAADNAKIITADNLQVPPAMRHLYGHLYDRNYIESLEGYDLNLLNIFARNVLKLIQANDKSWIDYVPAPAVEVIRSRHLFGYESVDS